MNHQVIFTEQDTTKVLIAWLYETNNQRRRELGSLVILCINPNLKAVATILGIKPSKILSSLKKFNQETQ